MASKRVQTSRKAQLESEILDLEETIEECKNKGDYYSAVQATKLWVDARRELARYVEADEISRAKDSLERIRKTRKAAARAGAHTAVKDLIRDEQRELERRRLQERELDPTAGMTEEELRDYLREEFTAMPSDHLAEAVRIYCDREGLDFPRRVLAGGIT